MQGENQLTEKVKRQEAQLALLSRIQKGLLSRKETNEIYVELGEKIEDFFDSQVAAIGIFNPPSDKKEFPEDNYHYLLKTKEHDSQRMSRFQLFNLL